MPTNALLRILLVPAIVLAALPVYAQNAAAEGPADTAPAVDGKALLRQVEMLVRLQPLNLTDDQLRQLDALYSAQGGNAGYVPNEATVAQLLLIQRKLLERAPLTHDDEAVLKGINKAARQNAGARPADRLAAITAILTPAQVAQCRTPARQLAIPAIRASKIAATAAVTRIERLVALPEANWGTGRDRLAEALTNGIQDVEKRATDRENVTAFMDRLRRLGADEVKAQRPRLAEELSALFPEGLTVDWSVLNPPATAAEGAPGAAAKPGRARAQQAAQKAAQDKQLAFWLDPAMPEVISQMLAARQTPAPAPAPAP